jgi:hypothetical protein
MDESLHLIESYCMTPFAMKSAELCRDTFVRSWHIRGRDE